MPKKLVIFLIAFGVILFVPIPYISTGREVVCQSLECATAARPGEIVWTPSLIQRILPSSY